MLRTFIQVTALSFALMSSFFLIKGTFALSVKDMVELSLTKWGANTDVLRNLTFNRADTITGFFLLLFSFILQTINLLWPLRIGDFGVNRNGVILALIVSIMAFLIATYATKAIQKHFFHKAEVLLDERLKK